MDNLTRQVRRRNMRAIQSKNTKPEIKVRSVLHGLGYRYSLHYKKLPGKPDIVLVKHRAIVLVNGCFWHSHDCKRGKVTPTTNPDFWENKRLRTVDRDSENITAYKEAGFRVLVIWECETKVVELLTQTLIGFLRHP